MMARRLLAWLSVGLGALLLVAGVLSLFQAIRLPATFSLPGSPASTLADQGLIALFGAGLVWVGVLRLLTRKSRND